MRIPRIKGLIKRRILANFRADPGAVQKILPKVFKPKLQNGNAIVGVCLIRLEKIRPIGIPGWLGISSENAAHRIAVTWKNEMGEEKDGVYILRRDTGSYFNHFTGGKVFPGEHHKAAFLVEMENGKLSFAMKSEDGKSDVSLEGERSPHFPKDSCFGSLDEASNFFKGGATGFSVTRDPCRLDGLVLETKSWSVSPLNVRSIDSKYYSDRSIFPLGTIHFDNALLMEDIDHEWRSTKDMVWERKN